MRKISIISVFILLFYACKDNSETDLNLQHLNHIAENINADLKSISEDLIDVSNKIQNSDLFNGDVEFKQEEKYHYHENQVLFSSYEIDKSAVYFPADKKLTKDIKNKIIQSEKLDEYFIDIIKENPLLAQSYFLDSNSFLRIYPYIDVVNYLKSSVDLTNLITYKTIKNKPFNSRNVYWINGSFADPYGRGWVISCAEPIHYRDQFIGMIAGDITLKSIKSKYFSSNTESILLLNNEGKLICCTKEAAKIINATQYRDFQYFKPVVEDIFITNRPELTDHQNKELKKAFENLLNGEVKQTFNIDNENYVIYKSLVSETNWYLLKIIN